MRIYKTLKDFKDRKSLFLKGINPDLQKQAFIIVESKGLYVYAPEAMKASPAQIGNSLEAKIARAGAMAVTMTNFEMPKVRLLTKPNQNFLVAEAKNSQLKVGLYDYNEGLYGDYLPLSFDTKLLRYTVSLKGSDGMWYEMASKKTNLQVDCKPVELARAIRVLFYSYLNVNPADPNSHWKELVSDTALINKAMLTEIKKPSVKTGSNP